IAFANPKTIRAAIIPQTRPPIDPSTVLLGLNVGQSLRRPASRPKVYAPTSDPLADAIRAATGIRPRYGPSSQRICTTKLPSRPTYAVANTVPAIVAIVRPGLTNWML